MKQYNFYTERDLTIVICAYKECEYLEESIKSVLNQTLIPNILIATSTPNVHIKDLSRKYNIPIRINPDGGQVNDYNFAMKQINTKIGMLAHQDDILEKDFVKKNLEMINYSKSPIIAFSNYREIHEENIAMKPSGMIKIKNILLFPLKFRFTRITGWGKRLCQRLGNPITHPTVVCVMDKMPSICFRESYRACMDWDLWERLSKEKGSFVYIKDILLYHRMSENNQTVQLYRMEENYRYNEELEIFSRFWPKSIARFIMIFYKKAEEYY